MHIANNLVNIALLAVLAVLFLDWNKSGTVDGRVNGLMQIQYYHNPSFLPNPA